MPRNNSGGPNEKPRKGPIAWLVDGARSLLGSAFEPSPKLQPETVDERDLRKFTIAGEIKTYAEIKELYRGARIQYRGSDPNKPSEELIMNANVFEVVWSEGADAPHLSIVRELGSSHAGEQNIGEDMIRIGRIELDAVCRNRGKVNPD